MRIFAELCFGEGASNRRVTPIEGDLWDWGGPWIGDFRPLSQRVSEMVQDRTNWSRLLEFLVITTPLILSWTEYCFRSISLFISLFLCQQDYEKTAGPIFTKFSRKVWWPRNDLIKFRVHSFKWVGGSKVNLLSPDFGLVWLLSFGSPVLPSSDWECNEIAVFGLLLHRNTGPGFVVLRTTACFKLFVIFLLWLYIR